MCFELFECIWKTKDDEFYKTHELAYPDTDAQFVENNSIESLAEEVDVAVILDRILHNHPNGESVINEHRSEFIKDNGLQEFIADWYLPYEEREKKYAAVSCQG
jgi:hypothetical protein